MNKSDRLNEIYKEYDLTKDDLFYHKNFTIIKREGIDKIQSIAKISIDYSMQYNSDDLKHIIIKATAVMGETKIITFGESSPDNYIQRSNTGYYPVAMAEKRAMSRAVLKLTGFYALGHFGQDEADAFSQQPDPATSQ